MRVLGHWVPCYHARLSEHCEVEAILAQTALALDQWLRNHPELRALYEASLYRTRGRGTTCQSLQGDARIYVDNVFSGSGTLLGLSQPDDLGKRGSRHLSAAGRRRAPLRRGLADPDECS